MNESGQPQRCSVLIVEDDPITRRALTMLLSLLGHKTCAVASVAEGLAKLDGQACAVLDLQLPDGLGTHILRRIRDEGRPIRVAIVSGIDDVRTLRDAEALGAELVLRKPLNVSTLLEWLDRSG